MRLPSFGIRAAVVALCTLVASLSGVILVITSASIARDVTERESAGVLRALGQEVAAQLARGVYVQWRELDGLRQFAEQSPRAEELRQRFDTITRLNDRYAWIGLAQPDGRITVAGGGLLEGSSVAERAWFRGGLQGGFAGDVRDALLLQRIMNAAEPPRVIDFAAPVRRPDGTVAGVIASHVSWASVRGVMQEALQGSGRDAILVARDGTILVGPPQLEGRAPSVPSLLAARQGATRTVVETWPDGIDYLSVVIAPIGHRDMPSFGWSLVIRQPAAAASAPARAITRQLAVSMVAVAVVVLLGSLLLGTMLARPLRRLRDSAVALADGRLHGPVPDLRGYREIRDVADALARVQSRLAAAAAEAAPGPVERAEERSARRAGIAAE